MAMLKQNIKKKGSLYSVKCSVCGKEFYVNVLRDVAICFDCQNRK